MGRRQASCRLLRLAPRKTLMAYIVVCRDVAERGRGVYCLRRKRDVPCGVELGLSCRRRISDRPDPCRATADIRCLSSFADLAGGSRCSSVVSFNNVQPSFRLFRNGSRISAGKRPPSNATRPILTYFLHFYMRQRSAKSTGAWRDPVRGAIKLYAPPAFELRCTAFFLRLHMGLGCYGGGCYISWPY